MTPKNRLLRDDRAIKMGYSADKRKRKNQHRVNAKQLLREAGFFAQGGQRGTTMHQVAKWHLDQARMLARS
ncbi:MULTISPECIES: hypothetical protein [unclassified Acidovorax]|uniref:hypothetical protein n=1 Tax=unclassified Acidovorax TaxID=2684926 RepID=UPI00234AB433|nr:MULTISPECIES: hypothetical protein [unclassified Acidovorax]WCM95483.1 hypothetical protein M5C96_13350 [Acidovorax sp. GBBC 1281]GKS95598.1 hypothetical protein AVAK2825_13705 [Acidovorax sp. SUPP2825]GKT19522.1 hypothetical protein AVHY2522_22775 [Acidovorax sp. SUPP2522]